MKHGAGLNLLDQAVLLLLQLGVLIYFLLHQELTVEKPAKVEVLLALETADDVSVSVAFSCCGSSSAGAGPLRDAGAAQEGRTSLSGIATKTLRRGACL
ncbi:hypothetical protein LX32DRAFT_131937 [Colletotrichum zoysiae]|uniref:Uncharacterized protein n=1 Tax=Colletotrichum zoysiae TaxID=1216348 RepID=A0AAD9LZ92_9PEZI|nr:hypothetical protein LX32DRAFT_131937 [Colletotrichum zoysiae]